MSTITFSKQMGFTRAEFDRLLPAALGGKPFDKLPDGIQTSVAAGSMRLIISAQHERKIASISMPYLDIEFIFEGVSEADMDETMRYFNLRYQRGGG